MSATIEIILFVALAIGGTWLYVDTGRLILERRRLLQERHKMLLTRLRQLEGGK